MYCYNICDATREIGPSDSLVDHSGDSVALISDIADVKHWGRGYTCPLGEG